MNFLIFGPEKPKLSFKQDPKRGTVVWCDNEYVLDYGPDKPITWRKIANRLSREEREQVRKGGVPLPHEKVSSEEEWHDVVKELKTLCQTDIERIFFDKITEAQEMWTRYSPAFLNDKSFQMLSHEAFKKDVQARERFFKSLLDRPALIPQVWVNWIQYDPRDKERAERSHLEPFRVDFLYQGEDRHEVFRKIIVEIDDIWHIADIEKSADDFLKSPEAKPSLGRFTEHLRKDRWLKHHGWEVCRFSTLEVKKEDCGYLYFEMQGEAESVGASPTYFPHKE